MNERETGMEMVCEGVEQDVCAEAVRGAVAEVLETMLREPCVPVDEPPTSRAVIRAAIRLTGGTDGECAVEVPVSLGDRLTDALLGAQADWDDEMIDDAVGELCNMVAGGVKRRLGTWAGGCVISLPVVCRLPATGRRERMEDEVAGWLVRRWYRLGADALGVEVSIYPVVGGMVC